MRVETAPPSSRRRSWPFTFRETFRFIFSLTLLVALVEYVRFADYVRTGAGAAVSRPVVADAFLPLAGVAALKTWLATGLWDQFHPVAIVVLIAVLVTAWLCRRAACSWLCPFGMVSEYLSKLGTKLFGRQLRVPKWLDRTLLAIKYTGTFALLFWLCITPVGSIRDFLSTPFYAVADMKLFDAYATLSIGIVAAVAIVVVMSMLVKSAWCRYLCPYGALQGMFGVLSPIRLVKNDSTCTGCARCNRACPNAVDVAHAHQVVTSAECMGCTSCISACPQPDTLQMRTLRRTRIAPVEFGLFFVAAFLVVLVVAVLSGRWGPGLPPTTYRQVLQISSDVHLPV
jgi:Pyruvate/2-oxoacid:ferredoxin oxidoreductase delta subunit